MRALKAAHRVEVWLYKITRNVVLRLVLGPPNTGISCRASSLAPRAVSFIPLFDGPHLESTHCRGALWLTCFT